jgi:galactonate dehydratase
VFTGKAGGVLLEALAAVDIALWDIMGKAANQPVHKLLGSMGRDRIEAYASSISWGADETAIAQTEQVVAQGFSLVKIKLGPPLDKALARARLVRRVAGDRVRLCADGNCAFDFDDALALARGLHDLGFYWLEEPIIAEDIEAYKRLRQQCPIRLAAGENEHTSYGSRDLIAAGAVGVIQPDVARSGGITETRRIATLGYAFGVPFAPHVGFSGAVCVAASLQLCAAVPNFLTFECMTFPNPLREELATINLGDPAALIDSTIEMPQGPGLGIEIEPDAIAKFRMFG